MRHVLHQGLLQSREPVEAETRVNNELAEVGGFSEGDKGGFGKKVLELRSVY